MQKLIEKFRANPSDANKERLQKYLDKHMMATCLLTASDITFLCEHGIRA